MKYFILVLSALAIMDVSFAATKVYRGKQTIADMCEKIEDNHYRDYKVDADTCRKSKFIIKDSAKDDLNDDGKLVSLVLVLSGDVKGVKFEVQLLAKLEVQPDGTRKRTGWNIGQITVAETTDLNTLLISWRNCDTCEVIDKSDVPKKIVSQIHINGILGDADTHKDDVSYEEDYQVIMSENGKNIIGYIHYIWFESELADIKGFEEVKFDPKGNQIDWSGETFGYHE